MPAPPKVVELVERFERNRGAYHGAGYNEEQLRNEFIDPFFAALRWDINNSDGLPDATKDVVREESILVGESKKAPDYSFRAGGRVKFFVEAKKPAINLFHHYESAFQLRRYGWSAKLGISVLTNFEHLFIYDCRFRPSKDQPPSFARVSPVYSFRDFVSSWDSISDLLSKPAVYAGSLDNYSRQLKGKKGTAPVDDSFLEDIDRWRKTLASEISSHDSSLSLFELNFAVQTTIDRLIFLRIAEDRGIEPYGALRSALKGGSTVYGRLLELFKRADTRYNSGLFHFDKERGRSEIEDLLTPGLRIGDLALDGIVRSLYYPDCPYAFAVIPADILGQVYEQFLGKVIRVGADRQVEVEFKAEVKKAGGVYYTPTYVVDYIVRSVLNRLGETGGPDVLSRARILDPACGSGSFLIRAYEYLLEWHREQYLASGRKRHEREGRIFRTERDQWRLSIAERKRILLTSIFGVDIDPQAVEVTKLSLLLKLLEGEDESSVRNTLVFHQERALPDLGHNIKCGNSLITPDYYTRFALPPGLDGTALNAFDWKKEYPTVFTPQESGFDAIVGNPPYFSIDEVWGKKDPRLAFIKEAFKDVHHDKTDVLIYFLTRAIELARPGRSEVSFIISRAFLEAYKADKARSWLAANSRLREVVDFRNYPVFPGVGITTAIVSLTKSPTSAPVDFYRLVGVLDPLRDLQPQKEDRSKFDRQEVDAGTLGSSPWVGAGATADAILRKIDSMGDPLGKVLHVGEGMQTGANDVFGKLEQSTVDSWNLPPEARFIRARNSDIQRYHINNSAEVLLYIEDYVSFESLPRAVQTHLVGHEAELKRRAAFLRGNCEWWRYTWPLHKDFVRTKRIYCPYMAETNRFAIDERSAYLGLTDTTVAFDAGQAESLYYILALLNSTLLTYRYRFIGKLRSGGILEYFWNGVGRLPIHRIDFVSDKERSCHDRITLLSQEVVALHDRISWVKTGHEVNAIHRQILAKEAAIDQEVCGLYGVSPEELSLIAPARALPNGAVNPAPTPP